jgi:hypothetical protein
MVREFCVAVATLVTTVDESSMESAANGSLSYAASISLGVIIGVIGLAAVLVTSVLLHRRLKLCQHIRYRYVYVYCLCNI